MDNQIVEQSNQLALNKNIKKYIDDIIVKNIYPGPKDAYEIIKKEYPDVRLVDVRKYLMTKPEYQMTFERKENKQTMGHIVSYAPFSVCQIDIFDMSKYSYDYTQYKSKKKLDGVKTNFNHGYKYIFCLIDVFSRYADCVMIKTKSIEDTCHALEIILDFNKINPFCLTSDSDSSFLGEKFQALLKSRDIELDPVIVNDHRALGIIDRFARTLKTRFTKLFLANDDTNWVDYIADIVYSYNNSPNRGILDYTPYQVITDRDIQEKILDLNIEKSERNEDLDERRDIKPGDKIRLYIENKMRKGTEPNFTSEVFEVKKRSGKKITLTNGKTILDQNILKIDDNQYIDNNLLIKNGDDKKNVNIIDETNKQNKINRKLKKEDLIRPSYDQLHEERSTRKKKIDFKKLNSTGK
jgi:hypothetical protein